MIHGSVTSIAVVRFRLLFGAVCRGSWTSKAPIQTAALKGLYAVFQPKLPPTEKKEISPAIPNRQG